MVVFLSLKVSTPCWCQPDRAQVPVRPGQQRGCVSGWDGVEAQAECLTWVSAFDAVWDMEVVVHLELW